MQGLVRCPTKPAPEQTAEGDLVSMGYRAGHWSGIAAYMCN